MEKTLHMIVRFLSFIALILVIMSMNQIYNQKIVALKSDQILEAIQAKTFTVRCVPSTINIDQEKKTVITSIDCDRWNYFLNTWYDSWIHFVTGDYSEQKFLDAEMWRLLLKHYVLVMNILQITSSSLHIAVSVNHKPTTLDRVCSGKKTAFNRRLFLCLKYVVNTVSWWQSFYHCTIDDRTR